MNHQAIYSYHDEKVGVRPLVMSDTTGGYRNWFNDAEVCRFNFHGIFPMTPIELEKFVASLEADKTRIVWAVCDVKNQRHIGNVALQSINWIYRSAEFAIVIGEKDYWGKGFAFKASWFIVNHGFEKMNLHRIHCGTAEANQGMRKLAANLKMKEEGTRREALFINGSYIDSIEFGVLRDEFYKP